MSAGPDLGQACDRAGQALETVSRSTWLQRVARWGLVVRGVTYVVVAFLALQVARGHRDQQADRDGALHAVASEPFGRLLLLALAVGFAGYALWRFVEAAVGPAEEGDATPNEGGTALAKRALSAARGVLYTTFFVTSLELAVSAHGGGAGEQEPDWTARLLHWPGGRGLVVVAGLVVVVVGAALSWQGLRGGFQDRLKRAEMTRRRRRVVVVAGAVGMTARGVVAVLVGIFLVAAAIHHDPNRAVGVDGALKRLADRSWGPAMLALVAAGLAAYGLFSFAEARFRRVGAS
ncbi:MAG: DUF1206 domain-containing protein [Acidimicrobiales bacterium]